MTRPERVELDSSLLLLTVRLTENEAEVLRALLNNHPLRTEMWVRIDLGGHMPATAEFSPRKAPLPLPTVT